MLGGRWVCLWHGRLRHRLISVRWRVEIHGGLIQHLGCGWKVGYHFPQPLFGDTKPVFDVPELSQHSADVPYFDHPFHDYHVWCREVLTFNLE